MSTIQKHLNENPDVAAGRESQQQAASLVTRREHDELLTAIHRFEAALASPAPSREPQWQARAASDLDEVQSLLDAHRLSAESADGLFAELELANPGIAARVTELRAEHLRLQEVAARLQRGLSSNERGCDYASLRQEAANFLTMLRTHYAKEVDLIFECFWTDIGVGD